MPVLVVKTRESGSSVCCTTAIFADSIESDMFCGVEAVTGVEARKAPRAATIEAGAICFLIGSIFSMLCTLYCFKKVK